MSSSSRQAEASLQAVAILPARLGSTRLPRKMLLARTGTALVVHTARRVAQCRAIARVLVATDAAEIARVAREAGIETVMTRREHPSGTDRVREAAAGLTQAYDPVVNVQADEPEIEPADLEALLRLFVDPEVRIATLCAPIHSRAELEDAAVVKVVRDARGDALYFSRAPIPDASHARGSTSAKQEPAVVGWRHVGVYAFRRVALEEFCALEPSPLEKSESLEQLRWLEAGGRMRVHAVRQAPHGIDTERDYEAFVARHGAPQPHPHG
jgi:3-deoxy-manno-octulosonate cytidylyltransferase (CMP-KDO synthetase)